MVYNQSDSDGTDDDDLPPTHLNRSQSTRKGRPSGNGKASGSVYIEQQIRQLELDAYTALLRAFGAQSEAISWAKETLMSDMRKELRVADEQHRELLGKVGHDETLKRIRTWRQTGEDPGFPGHSHDPSPSPAVSNSRKKQKTGHAAQTLPPPPPPPTLKSLPAPLLSPALGAGGGSRGKKTRSKGAAVAPLVPARGAPGVGVAGVTPGRGGAPGRGAAPWSNHKGAGPSSDAPVDQWIGRRVMTRWPEDNTFYDAIVSDYNDNTMLHCLVYDLGTPEETWEWVDLKRMDKKDVKWLEGPPVFLEGRAPPPPSVGRGAGRGLKRGRGGAAGVGRPKGGQRGRPAVSHEKVPLPALQSKSWAARGAVEADRNGSEKKVGRALEIQVPDLTAFVKEADELEQEEDLEKLESARRMAKEHEEMLCKALVQVGESSDDAGSDDGRHHPIDSPVHSVGLEKERQSGQDSGDRHADSEEEDETAGDRREDGSDGHHGRAEREGAVSDAEVDNADDGGEGDDER